MSQVIDVRLCFNPLSSKARPDHTPSKTTRGHRERFLALLEWQTDLVIPALRVLRGKTIRL